MSYFVEVMADAPIAYWRLGEPSGTSAADSSGNSRTGTYTNTPTLGGTGLIPADTNAAMAVATNSGQCMSVTSGTWMDVNNITVEAIVNITSGSDATNGDAIASRYNTGGFNWLLWRNTANKWAVQLRNNSGTVYNVATVANATASVNVHLAFTFDGSNLVLYQNGVQVGTTAVTGTVQTSTVNIEVGRYSATAATVPTAKIDEVAIYSTALSAARIAEHAKQLVPLTGTWGIAA